MQCNSSLRNGNVMAQNSLKPPPIPNNTMAVKFCKLMTMQGLASSDVRLRYWGQFCEHSHTCTVQGSRLPITWAASANQNMTMNILHWKPSVATMSRTPSTKAEQQSTRLACCERNLQDKQWHMLTDDKRYQLQSNYAHLNVGMGWDSNYCAFHPLMQYHKTARWKACWAGRRGGAESSTQNLLLSTTTLSPCQRESLVQHKSILQDGPVSEMGILQDMHTISNFTMVQFDRKHVQQCWLQLDAANNQQRAPAGQPPLAKQMNYNHYWGLQIDDFQK